MCVADVWAITGLVRALKLKYDSQDVTKSAEMQDSCIRMCRSYHTLCPHQVIGKFIQDIMIVCK